MLKLGELAKEHSTYVRMIERGKKNITPTYIESFQKTLQQDQR